MKNCSFFMGIGKAELRHCCTHNLHFVCISCFSSLIDLVFCVCSYLEELPRHYLVWNKQNLKKVKVSFAIFHIYCTCIWQKNRHLMIIERWFLSVLLKHLRFGCSLELGNYNGHLHMSRVVRKPFFFCICENKDEPVTAKLISAFVFAT